MVYRKERRRRQRVDAALPLEIEYRKERISTQTKNISVLGAYVETSKEIPRGIPIKIKIKIGRNKQISCVGIAFRSQALNSLESKKQYGAGIFFRTFAKRDERSLSNYIKHLLLQEKKLGKIFIRKRKHKQLKRKG